MPADYSPNDVFCEDYFIRGVEKGISNYENYRYLEIPTAKLAEVIVDYLDINYTDTFLDYGCARGYLVKAMEDYCSPFGVDISKWAIENSHPDIKKLVSNDLSFEGKTFDWIFSKDCLEHIPEPQLFPLIQSFSTSARKGIFILVPLANRLNGEYLREEDRKDITHVIRWPLQHWLAVLSEAAPDFVVQASWHIPGLKPASNKVPHSCGFFTLRRHHKNS